MESKHPRTGKNWFTPILKATLLTVVLPAVLFAVWFGSSIASFDRSDSELQAVTVYPGANEAAVSNLLYGRGLINSSLGYQLYARLRGRQGQLQAGTYEIAPSMTVAEITQKLTTGDVATYLLTILPSQRLSQLRNTFLAAGFSDADVNDALEPANYRGHAALSDKPPEASLEGYLYPESFQYTLSTPLSTIVKSSLDMTASLFTDDIKRALSEQGLSLHQGVILASIVEQEVNNPGDKPIVAQVFLTRLKMGGTLGSDVTAYYGASLGGLEETVAVNSPYNTRKYPGLPPGPISNISASSLRAVASPANTDYLYFVAGDDGITYFSHTLAEHTAMAKKHCKVLCQME